MPGRSALVSLLVIVVGLLLAAPAAALDIADAAPPGGTVGMPYGYTFSLSPGGGTDGASWTVDSGQLPPGLRLTSNDHTATVSGTPTQAGSFHFFLKVRVAPGQQGVCCTEEDFTIVIEQGLDITTGADLPVGNVGASYGYQLATSGGTASSWTITSGTLPAGIQLTQGGAITGTPTQTVASQFTVKAVAGGKTASKLFTLKVTEPMSVTAPTAKAIKLGRQFLVAFAAKGGLGPYTWGAVGLPEGIGVNPTTGQVGGRPKQPGPLVVTVKVTDSVGASMTASTTVTAAGKLAIATTKLPVARSGKRFGVTLQTSGGADPLALRLAGPTPKWLTLDATTGRLSGTPKLKPRKPLVLVKRTKHGLRRIVKRRPPLPASYTLYLTATDALGQRDTQRLKLIVRP
jgi:putative Ig domain-containing protein